MQKLISLALALWSLVAIVSAHGTIKSPTPRTPGATMGKFCGDTIYGNQEADPAGNIEGLLQNREKIVDYAACHIWLCKGYQFDDNKSNVHSYSPGEVVPIEVDIHAPHTGYANVSIVNTARNSVIGGPLISWADYASTATGVKPGDRNFSITIPSNLTGCTTAGECVIQWFWYSTEANQTYEGCIDFTIGGGSPYNPKNADDYASQSPSPTPTPTPTPTDNGYHNNPNTFRTSTTPIGGCGSGRDHKDGHHHSSKY